MVLGFEGSVRPSLALAVLMRGYNVTGAVLKTSQAGLDSLTLSGDALGTRTIPMDANGRVFINYRGPGGTFPRVSAADVLLGKADKAALAGKLVFLGSTAIGLRDIVATPLDRNAPGLEVQATLADMILSGDFIRGRNWPRAWSSLWWCSWAWALPPCCPGPAESGFSPPS